MSGDLYNNKRDVAFCVISFNFHSILEFVLTGFLSFGVSAGRCVALLSTEMTDGTSEGD